MADRYLDLSPPQAVELARTEGDWTYLDRYLRSRVIAYLQNREGDAGELRRAILDAIRWARAAEQEPWAVIWPYMLEILRDAERLPSTADELQVVEWPEGRAAQVLAILAGSGKPMRPKEVAARLGLSSSHATNLGRDLEKARLIVRRKAGGRATWLIATARGLRLASSWSGLKPDAGSGKAPADSQHEAEIRPWNEDAMTAGPEFKVA